MTEAEKLLQETKSAAVVAESQAEDICVIDSDMRIIDIPEQFKVLGVESDKDVRAMQFRIPKTYKGTDLSAFTISVNYQNARGTKGRYIVTDKKVSGDQIEFSWTVGKTATVYRGDTRFIVCMRLTGSDGVIEKEFNTTLATMTVLEGLEVDNPVIEQEEKDIIAQLLQIVDDKSKEAVQAVTEEGTKQIKAVQAAAQEIAADREQIKTNKADIADLRQTKAGAIINSAKGERIAVGDSSDAFFEGLKLFGKSEQVQTKGYQLFDASKIPTKSAGGATVTNNGDGSFTISGSGELSAEHYFYADITHAEAVKLFKAGKISLNNNGETYPKINFSFRTDQEKTTLGDSKNETETMLTEELVGDPLFYVRVFFYGKSGDTITPGTIRPMLYQSGDGTWEPFTGGKPSPSTDYPQEIDSTGGNGTLDIEVLGKNLYPKGDISTDNLNYKYTGIIPWTGKQNILLNFSAKTNVENGQLFIGAIYYDKDKKELRGNGKAEPCGTTFKQYHNVGFAGIGAASGANVDLRNVRYIELHFGIRNNTATHIDYKDIVIADSEGVNFTGYQPPQTLSIPTPNGLPGIKVTSGGNYTDSNGQQWICDELDFKRGKYVQRIGKRVFDGSESWVVSQKQDPKKIYYTNVSANKAIRVPVLCDKYIGVAKKDSSLENFETSLYQDVDNKYPTYNWLYIRDDSCSSLEDFKSKLSTNNITVYYKLKTPIETDIPEETMTAYRKLYTNYPSTVIQNDAGAGMEVEYVADTKQFILDQIKALVQA